MLVCRLACGRAADLSTDESGRFQVFPSEDRRTLRTCVRIVMESRRRLRPANLGLPAAVVKLVYTRRSGRRALTGVEVRVLSAASKCYVHTTARSSPDRGGLTLKGDRPLGDDDCGRAEFLRTRGQPAPARATASPAPPQRARPPPDSGRRASASPRRGGCVRFRATGRERRRGRRPWRARERRAGPRVRVG